MEILKVENLKKTYGFGETEVRAVDDISFSVEKGEFLCIIGASGSGKSTLLHLLGGVDRPTSGKVYINDVDIYAQDDDTLAVFRRRQVGLIYQFYNLIPVLTAEENITLPCDLDGKVVDPEEVKELIRSLGLEGRANHLPSQMSGGQQQRVAIARALATEPEILLCDEATSALDPNTTSSILELIRSIHAKLGLTVIVITHQMSVVEQICKHLAILDQGRVVEQGEVTEIFAHPRSAAAKRLVFPDENTETALPSRAGERLIRVVFNGAAATGSPLIARMAAQKGVEANIVYASAKSIGDKVYGSMLLGLPDDEEQLRIARDYLTSVPNVVIDEVSAHAG